MTETALTDAQVWDALRQVMDPELGINIVDLGLIYDVQVRGGEVNVKMTFTMRGCPMHGTLVAGAEAAIRPLPGVEQVNVEVVWDPPWSPEMMSAEARARLGR
jgi:metal-sulfur cluster biosynthetic enzyme